MQPLLEACLLCSPTATLGTALCSLGQGIPETLACCGLAPCCGPLNYALPCEWRSCAGESDPTEPRRTIAITGANRGVGLACARVLLQQGHHVLLLCRSVQLGQQAREALMRETGSDRVEVHHIDLGDLSTIEAFVAYADEKELTLAGLVCNAGLIGTHATRVNHMGHFALVLGLLASLERGVRRWGALGGGANVVVVSSVAHVQGALSMRDDHGNIDPVWRDADGAAKGDWAVYSESKAANALFSQGMARRLRESGVRTVSYHPGVMLTGLWRAKGENEGLDRLTLCRWMASLVVKHPRISGAGLASLAVPRSGVRCLLPRRGHPSGCGATLARMGQRCLCGDSGGYYQQCLCCCLIPVRAWPQIYSVGLQRTLWESSSQGLREECPELAEKVAARYPGLLSGPLKEEVIQKQPGARTEASSIQPGPPGRLLISPAPVCTEWLSCLPWCACVACLC